MDIQVRPVFCKPLKRSGTSIPPAYAGAERAYSIMVRALRAHLKAGYIPAVFTSCPSLISSLANRVESIYTLESPAVILFDWHATLVDTLDAVYHAIDDMLATIVDLGLIDRLTPPRESKNAEDAKLVAYVRERQRLHPKLEAEKKVSRTDIFEVLFGRDEQAKHSAHEEFDRHYRTHYGEVHPFEEGIAEVLRELKGLGLILGVCTNRKREFLDHELEVVDSGAWRERFSTVVGGDACSKRKPAPDVILKALAELKRKPGPDCWYVGDSSTDTVAAKTAGITSVFYNGAAWNPQWLAQIFPATPEHPHKPDAVVADFRDLLAFAKACLGKD